MSNDMNATFDARLLEQLMRYIEKEKRKMEDQAYKTRAYSSTVSYPLRAPKPVIADDIEDVDFS